MYDASKVEFCDLPSKDWALGVPIRIGFLTCQ